MKNVLALVVSCLLAASAHAADEQRPVKVFILAGQSNMEGQAVVDLDGKDYNDGKGTLDSLLRDPDKGSLFKHLKEPDGTWTSRVWKRGNLLPGRRCAGQRDDDPACSAA